MLQLAKHWSEAMKPKRIPRAVLAEAVKKAGTLSSQDVRIYLRLLETPICISRLSSYSIRDRHFKTKCLFSKGFHYSPHKHCAELSHNDFVECWSGDVNNPTIRRHKVGNCRVEV